MFRNTNPMMKKIDNFSLAEGIIINDKPMTAQGALTKLFFLLVIATIAAGAVVYSAFMGYESKIVTITGASIFIGFITAIIAAFKPMLSKFLAPIYAFAEGAALGGISIFAEIQFPGIALQAIAGTFVAFFIMTFLFKTRIIRATEQFKATVTSAIVTIMIMYLVNFVLSLFGVSIPAINGQGPFAIALSCVIVIVACLTFILDFDFLEKAEQNHLPKDFEWYGAISLMMTLVWLYVEILNLLSKLRRE